MAPTAASASFRKPLLRRNFSIERLGRKSSINALAPSKILQDEDGFESIDSYFPTNDDSGLVENKANRTPKNKTKPRKQEDWRIEPSPVKIPVEYEVLVEEPEPYEDVSIEQHDDGAIDQAVAADHVASPDVEDREIVFKKSVKPRPSLGSTFSPLASTPSFRKRQRPGAKKSSIKPPRKTKRVPMAESLVDVPSEDDTTDESGMLMRKSHRKRFAPLAFWKNEKVVYGRRTSASTAMLIDLRVGMPVIVDIVKKKESDEGRAGKGKRKTKRRRTNGSAPPNKYPKLDAAGVIRNFETKTEVETQLALSEDLASGDPVPGADFFIHTVFVEGNFMSSGVLVFPPKTDKPSRNSSKHSLVFYVIKGAFEVSIHKTTIAVHPNCMFYVPRGNQYAIRNVGTEGGRIFFCHCKDTASAQ